MEFKEGIIIGIIIGATLMFFSFYIADKIK
jgi:hypothetical protein